MNHPHAIMTMVNLAATYHQRGKNSEAEMLLKQCLAKQRSDTLHTMMNLINNYRQQHKNAEAERLYMEYLEKQNSLQG